MTYPKTIQEQIEEESLKVSPANRGIFKLGALFALSLKQEEFVSDAQLEIMKQAKREGFELAIQFITNLIEENENGSAYFDDLIDHLKDHGLDTGILPQSEEKEVKTDE